MHLHLHLHLSRSQWPLGRHKRCNPLPPFYFVLRFSYGVAKLQPCFPNASFVGPFFSLLTLFLLKSSWQALMILIHAHSDINTTYFIWFFKKNLASDHLKTSNLSADNFKKVLDLDGSTPEPTIRSGYTGQRIHCFDSCQLIRGYYPWLITTLMCNQFSPGLPKFLEIVKVNIGSPVVQTEGRSGSRSVYGHVITKFSGMGRFT